MRKLPRQSRHTPYLIMILPRLVEAAFDDAGGLWVRFEDGLEGTVPAEALRRRGYRAGTGDEVNIGPEGALTLGGGMVIGSGVLYGLIAARLN